MTPRILEHGYMEMVRQMAALADARVRGGGAELRVTAERAREAEAAFATARMDLLLTVEHYRRLLEDPSESLEQAA